MESFAKLAFNIRSKRDNVEPSEDRPNDTVTWREQVQRAAREGDYKRLLELARQLTTHLTERLENQPLGTPSKPHDSYR